MNYTEYTNFINHFSSFISLVGETSKTIYTLDYIIERKTADDLAASIMDRRYNQQKYRLMNSSIKNIFYFVEGKAS